MAYKLSRVKILGFVYMIVIVWILLYLRGNPQLLYMTVLDYFFGHKAVVLLETLGDKCYQSTCSAEAEWHCVDRQTERVKVMKSGSIGRLLSPLHHNRRLRMGWVQGYEWAPLRKWYTLSCHLPTMYNQLIVDNMIRTVTVRCQASIPWNSFMKLYYHII